jgi:DNA-binding SARP family transcriptional activator
MPLYIRTLGDAAVACSDPVEAFPIGKPFALLVYLALRQRQRFERQELAGLLWPHSTREKGLQSLRQALWLLRGEFGEDLFLPGERVQLRAGVVRVDVQDLRDHLAGGAIDEAEALRRGPFLITVAIPGAPEWDRWVDEIRAEVDRRLGNALSARALDMRARGKTLQAIGVLRRAVEIDPFEPNHPPLLAELLLDARQLEAAAEIIAQARRDAPGPEYVPALERLEARLSSLRSELAAARASAIGMPEFVGRSADLALLLSRWRMVRGRRSLPAVVRGPTGIGKTRLAEELSAAARADGAKTLMAKAAEAERFLDWALVTTLVRRLLTTPGSAGITAASDAVLRSLVPSLSSNRLPDAPAQSASTIADALRDLVGAVAYETPLLLVLDDFHWADPASRSVLTRVIRETRDEPVLFLLTYRPEDTSIETGRAIDTLAREDGVAMLTLRPFSRAETAELLGLLIDYSVPDEADAVVDRLHEASGGNPLFLLELVKLLHADGTIGIDGDRLILRMDRLPSSVAIPASMQAVLERRLDGLGPDAAEVARQLASAPPRATAADVRAAAALTDSSFLRAVNELDERDIVAWDGDRLVFAHDQLREAALRRFGAARPPGGPRPMRARAMRAAFAALAALAATALLLTAVRAPGPDRLSAPWGSGTIYFRSGDSVLAVRSNGFSWTVGPMTGRRFRSANSVGPFATPTGAHRWFEMVEDDPAEAPYIAEILPDESRSTIARMDGLDIGAPALSPDGRWVTYLAQNPEAEGYPIDLVLADSAGSPVRTLYRGEGRLGPGLWSPDGRRLAFTIFGREDTLAVLTAFDVRTASFTFRTINDVAWCGSDVIGASVQIGNEWFIAAIDLRSGEVERIETPVRGPNVIGIRSELVCSPDARVMIFERLSYDREETVAYDRATGQISPIPVPAGAPPLFWIPDTLPVIETGVGITRAPRTVRWAETDTVEASIHYSDGTSRSGNAVTWASSDAATLSVSASGEVTGNRPGTALIIAQGGGWHSDTVEIAVRGVMEDRVVFRDTFPTLDTARWVLLGVPVPRLTVVEGHRVLELTGDGQWSDGLVLRDPVRLQRGGTLEVEFRFELNRRDRQKVRLCLVDWDRVDGHDEHSTEGWLDNKWICAMYPSGELARFDSAAIDFSATAWHAKFDAGGDLPSSAWTHVALQVRPDGKASLYLNRRHVAETPHAIPMPAEGWRAALFGAALETRVFARNLALSHGPRFAPGLPSKR